VLLKDHRSHPCAPETRSVCGTPARPATNTNH
jgi:hypothetical protein